MEVKKRLAAAGAAAAVVAGIAVVQSGVTGTPWPSSSPVRDGSPTSGLPAPGEADGALPTAGVVRDPAAGTVASRGTARTSSAARAVKATPTKTKSKLKEPKPDQVKPAEPKPKDKSGSPKIRLPKADPDSGPAKAGGGDQ